MNSKGMSLILLWKVRGVVVERRRFGACERAQQPWTCRRGCALTAFVKLCGSKNIYLLAEKGCQTASLSQYLVCGTGRASVKDNRVAWDIHDTALISWTYAPDTPLPTYNMGFKQAHVPRENQSFVHFHNSSKHSSLL